MRILERICRYLIADSLAWERAKRKEAERRWLEGHDARLMDLNRKWLSAYVMETSRADKLSFRLDEVERVLDKHGVPRHSPITGNELEAWARIEEHFDPINGEQNG